MRGLQAWSRTGRNLTSDYAHVAPDAGFDLGAYPAVGDWLERVRALPGYVNDLVPYPDNARPGRSESIYD